MSVAFGGVHGSVGCSTTTHERRERIRIPRFGGELGHYGLHAHPGCAEESESSGGTVDHRHDPQGARDPTSGERPTSWQAFLRAHWKAVVAADFFTTEIWTVRGLVTYYTLFVIELHSRRVSIVGSTPHPDEAFVRQVIRQLTAADEGVLDGHRVLICDRDRKWSIAVRELLETSGVAWSRHRSVPPTAMRMLNALFGPSKRNAWIG